MQALQYLRACPLPEAKIEIRNAHGFARSYCHDFLHAPAAFRGDAETLYPEGLLKLLSDH